MGKRLEIELPTVEKKCILWNTKYQIEKLKYFLNAVNVARHTTTKLLTTTNLPNLTKLYINIKYFFNYTFLKKDIDKYIKIINMQIP